MSEEIRANNTNKSTFKRLQEQRNLASNQNRQNSSLYNNVDSNNLDTFELSSGNKINGTKSNVNGSLNQHLESLGTGQYVQALGQNFVNFLNQYGSQDILLQYGEDFYYNYYYRAYNSMDRHNQLKWPELPTIPAEPEPEEVDNPPRIAFIVDSDGNKPKPTTTPTTVQTTAPTPTTVQTTAPAPTPTTPQTTTPAPTPTAAPPSGTTGTSGRQTTAPTQAPKPTPAPSKPTGYDRFQIEDIYRPTRIPEPPRSSRGGGRMPGGGNRDHRLN